jgi:hypothetical protein
MGRYRQSSEEMLLMDLDTGFLGLNNRLDPSLLRQGASWTDVREEAMAPGLVAESINVRFGRGQAETRPGLLTPVHFNTPDFVGLRGAGIFSDPNGREWLLAADAVATWLMADGETPQKVELPGGVVLQETVKIVQAFDTVLMFRGFDEPTLCWKGDRREPWTTPAQEAPNPDAPSFLDPIPNAPWGVTHGNRVWVPVSRDEMAYSDLQDYTNFDLTLAVVRINAGNDDSLVTAVPFRGGRLIVFKDQSFYGLSGTEGDDLFNTLTVEVLSTEIGCAAGDTVCTVGGDLIWLANGHVYRMSEALQDSLQASAVPVSLSIEATMRRVNWQHVAAAQAVVIDQYYMLALPVDGSTSNNALLVYDTTTRQWQGIETPDVPEGVRDEIEVTNEYQWSDSPSSGLGSLLETSGQVILELDATRLLKTDLFGRKTAFVLQPARILALGHGHADYVDGRIWPIYTRVQTRGYVFGQLGIKQVREILLAVETWDAEVTVTLILDGVAEEKVILDRKTRQKSRRTRHGLPAWVVTNVNDDHGAAHREDYQVVPGDATQPRSGWNHFAPQHWTISFPVRANARWAAVRLESFRGFVRLKAVQAEARPERQFNKHVA